jgi:hypothetical protein
LWKNKAGSRRPVSAACFLVCSKLPKVPRSPVWFRLIPSEAQEFRPESGSNGRSEKNSPQSEIQLRERNIFTQYYGKLC